MVFRAELYDEHGDCLTLSYARVYINMVIRWVDVR